MDKKGEVLIDGEVVGYASFDSYLMVEIPKKYKKRLEERWNLRKFKKEGIINDRCMFTGYIYANKRSCPLCSDSLAVSKQGPLKCKECPFYKFRSFDPLRLGCMKWLDLLVGNFSVLSIHAWGIIWLMENDEEAREKVKEIRKRAKKYIKWV